MDIAGSVALVTGGGTGIGRSVAEALAVAGSRVVITGRREAVLRDSAASIGSPEPVTYRAVDMADARQVHDLVDWLEAEMGPLALLVNNAGVNIQKRDLASLSIENWDYVMQVNANGAFYIVHAVLPHMRARRDGLIINISSMAAVRASSVSGAAYSASKYALNALTQVLAEEEGRHGIRATCICPGAVNTPILDDRPVKVSEERRRQILQPEDVAAAVMFVVSLPRRAHVPELQIRPSLPD